jgi:hypothetical protein
MALMVVDCAEHVVENVPSSSLGDERACPWSYGAIR